VVRPSLLLAVALGGTRWHPSQLPHLSDGEIKADLDYGRDDHGRLGIDVYPEHTNTVERPGEDDDFLLIDEGRDG
jgi:hypothetical protein